MIVIAASIISIMKTAVTVSKPALERKNVLRIFLRHYLIGITDSSSGENLDSVSCSWRNLEIWVYAGYVGYIDLYQVAFYHGDEWG